MTVSTVSRKMMKKTWTEKYFSIQSEPDIIAMSRPYGVAGIILNLMVLKLSSYGYRVGI